ncbi:hypothetical protein LRP88_01746 [Fusarium phalaenopsidis]
MKRLVCEIRAVPDKSDLTSHVLQRMKYLNAVIEEALRIYPVGQIGLGTQREIAPGGNRVCGEFLAEGTEVAVAAWTMNNSPLHWKDPQKFVPERWIPGQVQFSEYHEYDNRAAWLAFGTGPRTCIGQNIALHEIRGILGRILYDFDLALTPNTVDWIQFKTNNIWAKLPLQARLLYRHIRIFDHTKFTDGGGDDFPIVFQCVEPWSQHVQLATTELCEPGTHLAVDEAMIRYTGRNKQVAYVPNKPIDTGFKVWIAAQLGLFMRWIWHQPGAKYGPVGVQKKKPASQRKKSKVNSKGPSKANKADEVKEVIYVITEAGDKIMALNLTQSVIIALINLLPQSIYHVFVDNLFSSPDLFRSLRQHGHGATGIARPNYGIYKGLADAKKADKAGKSGFQFNEIKVIPTANNQVNQIA